jgi:hypothetical protein
MAQLVKRRRLEAVSEVDRNMAPVVDVALQTGHSLVNMEAIRTTRELFADGADHITLSLGDNDYQPKAMMPVFRDLADRRHTLYVEGVINGKDIPLVALYPGDPEMVRWALKRRYQVVGIAGQNSERLDSKDDPDLGFIKAGLQTLEAVGAVAGSRAVFEWPPLGGADPRVGSMADGTDCRVQTLYTRPYNAALTSERFERAIAHMIYDPLQWAQAMKGYSTSTNVFLNAAKNKLDSHIFTALVMIEQLIADKKLIPNPGNELDARDAQGAVDSVGAVGRLSQFLQLTPNRGDVSLLNSDKYKYYMTAKVNFARRAFYVPTPEGAINITDEFAYRWDADRQQYGSPARTPDGKELLTGTVPADLVAIQVNHNKLATAAVLECVNEEERYVAGSYVSGSSEKGARKAVISLGVAS